MKLINSEKAIDYAKEKDYIITSGQEEAVREVFALATVEAVPIDVLDKIRAEIDDARFINKDIRFCKNALASGLEVAMQIIDKYKAESKGE